MTRTIALIIAALVLAIVGCKGEPILDEAPAVEDQGAAEAEEAPALAASNPMCDLLAGKHAEQVTQTMVLYDQLGRARATQDKDQAARLDERIADALPKSARTRAEMKRLGCVDIPEPPEVEVIGAGSGPGK